MAFIINQHSPAITDILRGLQSANRAQVIVEGEPPLSETFTMDLPDGVKLRMRTAELVNADGSVDLQPDATVLNPTTEDAALKQAMKANNLLCRSATEVKLPRRITFRMITPKMTSIWLSHELCFGR